MAPEIFKKSTSIAHWHCHFMLSMAHTQLVTVSPSTFGPSASSPTSCSVVTRHSIKTRSRKRCRPSSAATLSSSPVRVIHHFPEGRCTTCLLTPTHLLAEYWANVSQTARDFVNVCLTVDPTSRPTAAEMLQHKWVASERPHFVPDPESPTGGPTDLLPNIQKVFNARKTCTWCLFFYAISRAGVADSCLCDSL
jgi:serine/threonine protein kinase